LKFSNISFIILPIFILLNSYSFTQNKTATAIRVDSPPIIDGHLNDEVWKHAIPITDLVQSEPIPGAAPSFKTEIRILYDDDNLYVSFMCYDPEPEKIVARELKLDGRWSGDDNVAIVFDTFKDNRNGYWFGTNPLGMRNDALITSGKDFSGFNEEWHGVWKPSSAITDSGWSTEIVFPFSTFKFQDKDEQIWGINFERNIRRLAEQINWTSYGKNQSFFQLNFAGDLIGIKNISRGDPIYVKPFLTAGIQKTDILEKTVVKPGLDIKYGFTETLSLDLTFNTDFAQVESDLAKINLSRFPLFFPEKRDFFLEGANIFKYSIGGTHLFYSRRIGISGGTEIPIIAGAKLVGREGNFEIGALNIQTAPKGNEPTTNYGVARIKYDLFEQSYAGIFFSNKISKEGFNRVAAGDFVYANSEFLGDKTILIGTGVAKSEESNGAPHSWASKFFIEYPNDLIYQFFTYRFIQKNFNPGIGFVPRSGFQTFIYNFRINPRVNYGMIKKLNFIPIESYFDLDKNNELLSASFNFRPLGFTTIQNDAFTFEIKRNFDLIEEDFNIFGSSVIPKGKYWFTTYDFAVSFFRSRPVYGEAEYYFGDYYTGRRKTLGLNFTVTANKHLSVLGEYRHNNITLADGKFKTNEFGTWLRYDFSTKLNSSVFAQWNNELDEVNFNYRIKWEPEVGSNFYIVVNHLLSSENKLRSKDITILAKIVWLIII
jgi:hypothetical protein